jgi:hypothetical protein
MLPSDQIWTSWFHASFWEIRIENVIPGFMPKPSTHRMHDPGLIVPHIRPKEYTDNQMSQPIPRRWWHLGLCMQVDQGLLHGLKHLCLHSEHLLKSKRRGWWLVGFLVVALPIVFSIVGGNMVPCVDHLKYED